MIKFSKKTFLTHFERLAKRRILAACEDYGLDPSETTIPQVGMWEEPNQWVTKISILLAPVAVRAMDLAVEAAGGGVKILTQKEYKQMSKEMVPDYDRKYDAIEFEIKTSQSAAGNFSGATNSKGRGKVDNYGFFSYRVNEEKTIQELLDSGTLFVELAALCFAEGVSVNWLGKESANNSRTSSQILPSSSGAIEEGMVFGGYKINEKSIKLIRVPVEGILEDLEKSEPTNNTNFAHIQGLA